MTPTGHSLELLRRSGYVAAVVETWIPHANKRRDLFGFADIIGVHRHREPRFLLVQTTSLANVAARLSKAKGRPELRTWLSAGGAFEVHGWAIRSGRWHVRRVGVQADSLEPIPLTAIPRRCRRAKQATMFDSFS